MNHPLSDMMTNSMSKIRDMIDVNTVVGDPITTPGGVTIIPVTKVSIGYGGGGSDFAMKNMPANRDNPFSAAAPALDQDHAGGVSGHPRRKRADAPGRGARVHVGRPADRAAARPAGKGEAYFAEKKAAKEAEKAAEEA